MQYLNLFIQPFIRALIPLTILILGVGVACAIIYFWRKRIASGRQSPLTRAMLRPPGYSLSLKIDDVTTDICGYVLGIMFAPLLFFSSLLSQSIYHPRAYGIADFIFLGLTCVVGQFLLGRKLWRLLTDRRKFVLGRDGEMCTGEELNQLMLSGCRVFHDVPHKRGNIDHVVISYSGLFAVNTKMIGKIPSTGSADVTVDYKRMLLIFPNRTDSFKKQSSQIEAEAKWLSEHLSGCLGRKVEAQPMMALPGWYIAQRIGYGPLCVFNPIKAQRFFLQDRKAFSPEVIDQMAFHLEKLCRDVAPSYQSPIKSWPNKD